MTAAASTSSSSSRGSSNPFGAAKPREEVLAKKGIDAKLVDARIEKKVTPVRLTKDQEEEVEALRQELTVVEAELREANEKELPEESLRVQAEAKRQLLNDLVAKFADLNTVATTTTGAAGPSLTSTTRTGAGGAAPTATRQKFERPSERRKRLDQQQNGEGDGDYHNNNTSSYNNNSNRGGGRYNNHNDNNDDDYQQDDAYSSFGGRSNNNSNNRYDN